MGRATQVTMFVSLLLLAGCGKSDRVLYPLEQGLTWEYQVQLGSGFESGGGQRATLTNFPERELTAVER